jgi:predicted enzyme related to lactoylglutathione lyase
MSQTVGVRLGSLVLGSDDPDRLSAWYRTAFAPSAEVGTVLDLSSGRLIFDRRGDLEQVPREPGRILINLYVENIRAVEAHLNALGVEWVRPVESFPPGTIATLKDRDGNYVQIIELVDRPRTGQ